MKSIDKPSLVAGSVLFFIFGFVVFHAPFSVFFGQYVSPDLVKGWKEALMLLIIPLILFVLWRSGNLKQLSKDYLLQLIGVYAVWHLLLVFLFDTSSYQKVAGLAIDLRYLLFFALLYCFIFAWPKSRTVFLKIGAIAAVISLIFALLQATLLPDDLLKYIGYSEQTITSHQTVDKNSDYIRINGTLRGPNPLGAYVVVVISLLIAWVVTHKKTASRQKWLIIGTTILMMTVLWASYSRSAFLAFIISLVIIVGIALKHRINIKSLLIGGMFVLIMIGSIVALRNSSIVQNVILHDDPTTGAIVPSNQAHIDSLAYGLERTILQPFGAGIGSTGSPSLGSESPTIIENQYLAIAHEVGWFGLALFVIIYMCILTSLYRHRRDWLSLGVFASGIGLAVIGVLLPVWVDDTVSLVWFGLAAIAIASKLKGKNSAPTN